MPGEIIGETFLLLAHCHVRGTRAADSSSSAAVRPRRLTPVDLTSRLPGADRSMSLGHDLMATELPCCSSTVEDGTTPRPAATPPCRPTAARPPAPGQRSGCGGSHPTPLRQDDPS